MLLYSRLQFLSLILIDLSIRFTKTDAANDVPVNRLETVLLQEESKFEKSLVSTKELSQTLVEMQRENGINLLQTASDIQAITERLRIIESQVKQLQQTQTFNERFELFQDSYKKEGVQFDDIKQKAEIYQLLTSNLMDELGSSIEKVIETQDTLLREVQKINITQNHLVTIVNQLNESIETEWNKFYTSLRASQQNFTEEIKDMLKNFTTFMTAAIDIITHKSKSETSTQTHSEVRNDDGILLYWLGQIFNMKKKFETTQEEIKSVKSSIDKCISVGERMHEDFVVQKMDFIHSMSEIQRLITDELRKRESDIDRLSMSFQSSIVPLQTEQEMFKNNCYLIRANEDRLEESALYVLERLFGFINNHTEGIRSDLDRLQQYGMKQSTEQTKEIQKIKELLDNQKKCAAKETEVTKKPSTARPADVQSKRPKLNYAQTTPHTTTLSDSIMFDDYEDLLDDEEDS